MKDASPAAVTASLIFAGINPHDERDQQRYRNLVRAAVYTGHYDDVGYIQSHFGMSDEEVARQADDLWASYVSPAWG
jgi:hypothetical protein